MNKKGKHLKQILITTGLIFIINTISACSDEISQENRNENEINISQEQDIAIKSGNSPNISAGIKPDISETLDNSIPLSVSENPDISIRKIYGLREITENEQRNTYYTLHHEKDNSTYKVMIIGNENFNYTLQLFDKDFNMLQTFDFDGVNIQFEDVNMDGYTDIVVGTGGTMNEIHDLYVWDDSSKNFIKVIYVGFEMLAWFKTYEGYIDNFIRGRTPEDSYDQTLIWNGNILINIEKDWIENEQINAYTLHHEKDNSMYAVMLMRDENFNYTLQFFGKDSNMLQTLELEGGFERIEFKDVNKDGYTDIVVTKNLNRDQTYDLYIWDDSSENFIKVIYDGFETLTEFIAHESYIYNSGQILVWNGNTLTKIDISSNPYFFPNNITKKTYMISDVNAFDEGYQECTLEINLLGRIGAGELYSLKIADSNLKKHSTVITIDRTDLGCFYVTDDEIYKMTRAEGENLLNSTTLNNDLVLPYNAVLVYQDGLKSLNKSGCYGYYGWQIGGIENKNDIFEFDSFVNRDEYYEYIAWKKGSGIVYYNNGWGGKEGGIYMIAKDSKVYETIKNYENALPQAINNGKFDMVSSFIIPDSDLYNSQKELVSRLYSKGIQEQLNSFYIYSISILKSGLIRIYVEENIGVKYPGESDFTNHNYKWEYKMRNVDGQQIGLSDINK